MAAGEEIRLFVHHYDQAQPGSPIPRGGGGPSRTSRGVGRDVCGGAATTTKTSRGFAS